MKRETNRDRRGFLQRAALAPAGLALGGLAVGGLAVGGLPLAARAATAGDAKLKIGIVGSGNVGGALGRVWAKAGH